MDQYIGKTLDSRYEILEVIGTGGMAVVYKAHDPRLNRKVAIKILRDDLARDAEFRRRFHDESQAVAMLSHPNIMAVYDVSRSSDVEYIVMELIDGITLKQYMQKRGGPLGWKEALHFITQIMKALSHAHSRGIIHRDIKPQNIMVLRDGSIKVTDFGIARLASAAQNTLTQEALGSVHYISPEQARGSRIDARSDIYSAGVVLYEMLTGRLPFEGDTPVSVAIQHISSVPLPPRDLNPDIPEALEAITMKAMAPNVDNRYRSADEMLVDLEEFRKNPSINFDYTPDDLLTPDGETDEPTQIISTPRRSGSSRAPERRRPKAESLEETRVTEVRPRKKQGGSMSVPLAVASILIFIVGIGVLFWVIFFSNTFQQENSHSVPNLINMTLDEARSDSRVEGIFTIVEGERAPSSTVEEGRIIDQDPQPRSVVTGDDLTITVTVSSGAEPLYMPDLVNQDYREAYQELVNMDLTNITVESEYSDITKDFVSRTDPMQGSTITTETPVTIYVSLGPEPVVRTMPNVVGETLETARTWLEGVNGLNLVVTTTEVDSEEPAGTVVYQSIPVGESVEEGTTVMLQVSNGSGAPSEESPAVSEEPSTSQEPAVNSVRVEIVLPKDGDSSDMVEVQLNGGAGYVHTQTVERRVNSVVFTLTGTGTHSYSVYFDGVYSHNITVDFTNPTGTENSQ